MSPPTVYLPPAMTMTGQEILARAVERAGGAAELGRKIRARELMPKADAVGPQIARWAKPDGPKIPADIVVRALNYIGAINWDALEMQPPAGAERLRGPTASAQQKTARVQKKAGGGTP